jgi:formate dehydrogenase gamma subunit
LSRLALLALLTLLPVRSPALDDDDCLACHGDESAVDDTGRSVFVNAERRAASVHGGFACADCHGEITEYPHPKPVPRARCASCHEDTAEEFAASVHASARRNGDRSAPGCTSCHGPAHEILPADDPRSRVSKKILPETCGACHANPDFVARHNLPFARPVETYRLSVHGRAVQEGNDAAATCSDCHGSHSTVPARDPKSPINHWNVAKTCSRCHEEIGKVFAESIHGQAVGRGATGAPVCTDCHGEHAILAPAEPGSLVNPARVSSVTCGRCHADERLAQQYNLPAENVAAYRDSFHGLAQRSGSQTVANCASCHGIHNILPSKDPRSTVNPANLGKTCGACHPGAGQRFAIGPIHVRPGTATEHPVVRLIRVLYVWLIPLTLGFMVLHNLLDFVAKLVRGVARGHSPDQVPRMNLHFRIAHWLTVLSFPVLVVTGFALKYPESWWAQPIVAWEGQMAFRGAIHRGAGVVLLVSLLYHVIHLALSPKDRVILRNMVPRARDVSDAWALTLFNVGLRNERPTFGMFSYAEKAEYLAYVWGSAIMALTGLLLWFNNLTLAHLPSWVADAATVTHFYEAVLATGAILVWHFYMVIFDPAVYPMDLAWITGRASADHLKETRPEYYLDVRSREAAERARPKPADTADEGTDPEEG